MTAHQELHAVGTLLDSLGLSERSAETFRKGIKVSPASPGMWNGLGLALVHANHIDEAIAALERARDLSPQDTTILTNLAWARSQGWRVDEALDACARRGGEHPGHVEARKLLVFLLNYSDRAMPREVFECMCHLGHTSRCGGRRGLGCRLWWMMACRHSIARGRALEPGFARASGGEVHRAFAWGRIVSRTQLHCYSIAAVEDATSQRLRRLADSWQTLHADDGRGCRTSACVRISWMCLWT